MGNGWNNPTAGHLPLPRVKDDTDDPPLPRVEPQVGGVTYIWPSAHHIHRLLGHVGEIVDDIRALPVEAASRPRLVRLLAEYLYLARASCPSFGPTTRSSRAT